MPNYTPIVTVIKEAEHALEAMLHICPEGSVRVAANALAARWGVTARRCVEALVAPVADVQIKAMLSLVRQAGSTMQKIVELCTVATVKNLLIAAWQTWLDIALPLLQSLELTPALAVK